MYAEILLGVVSPYDGVTLLRVSAWSREHKGVNFKYRSILKRDEKTDCGKNKFDLLAMKNEPPAFFDFRTPFFQKNAILAYSVMS